jgi:hypothetical protein
MNLQALAELMVYQSPTMSATDRPCRRRHPAKQAPYDTDKVDFRGSGAACALARIHRNGRQLSRGSDEGLDGGGEPAGIGDREAVSEAGESGPQLGEAAGGALVLFVVR